MEPDQVQTKHSHTLISVLAGLVLIVIVGAAFVWYASKQAVPAVQGKTVDDYLIADNAAFARAEQIPHTPAHGDELTQLYKEALAQAKDANETGHVTYKLANAYVLTSHYLDAIPLYKSVVANPTYKEFDRAYAAQGLADMYYSISDPKIMELTFADEPYKSMVVPGDTALTYRHLHEFVSAIYPLAISEARIAYWYSHDLFRASAAGTSSIAFARDLDQITTHVKNAQNDILRTQDLPAKNDIPAALLRLAIVDANLALLKVKQPADAEASYKAAQDAAVRITGAPDPYGYLQYAQFLVTMYGSSANSRIHDALAPLEDGTIPRDSTKFFAFLGNQRTNASARKSTYIPLAKADPAFKALLLSLGWQESDFK